MELSDALRRVFKTDAHIFPYVLIDPTGEPLVYQPRLNFSCIPWIYSLGYEIQVTCLLGDVDNPEHKPWTLEWLEAAEHQLRTNAWLRDKGHYYSKNGYRVIQELTESIPLVGAFHIPALWIEEGRKAGVPLDVKCGEINREYRAPHANRDGNRQTDEEFRYHCDTMSMIPRNLSAWARIPRYDAATLEAFGPLGRATLERYAARYGYESDSTTTTSRKTGPRHSAGSTMVRPVPPEWIPRCEQIAQPCSHIPLGERHTFYMYLAGGLCHRRVPIEFVPSIIHLVATLAGHDGNHHAKTAKDTIVRYKEGLSVTGLRSIQARYPVVAQMLAEIGLRPGHQKVVEQQEQIATETPPATPLQNVQWAMAQEMRYCEPGITIIASICGSGKTTVARDVANERFVQYPAKETRRRKIINNVEVEEITMRIPSDGRTIISSDKHSLSMQTQRGFEAMGTPVCRFFGAASLRNPDGTYVCIYQPAVAAFSEGGLSPGKYLCISCERSGNCAAQKGWEGTEKAPVALTVHSKLSSAVAHGGKHALTIIDEPPSAVHNVVLTEKDFEQALQCLGIFDRRYADALEPLVRAIHAWISQEWIDTTIYKITELADVLTPLIRPTALMVAMAATQCPETGAMGSDALECARRARPQGMEDEAPPIRMSEAAMARRYTSRAQLIARAAKTLHTVHQAALGLSAPSKPLVRAEETRTGHALRVVYPNHEYRAILLRQSKIILTDANGDLQVPVIQALTGMTPALKRFSVEDGAPIERMILPYATATRSMWLPAGLPLWDNGLLHALARGLQVLRTPSAAPGAPGSDARAVSDVYIITFLPVAVALRAAMQPHESIWRERWANLGLHPQALDQAIAKLTPILQWWDGKITAAYFGGTRGLNDGEKCHATLTLGDPRPNLGTVDLEARFLGLKEEDWVTRLARAELEQCHGRLRAVQRQVPGRMLHIGCVVPGGYGWDKAVTLAAEPGHTSLPVVMTAQELVNIRHALGLTQTDFALRLGVSVRSLKNYEGGRAIPKGVAAALRMMYSAQATA